MSVKQTVIIPVSRRECEKIIKGKNYLNKFKIVLSHLRTNDSTFLFLCVREKGKKERTLGRRSWYTTVRMPRDGEWACMR